MGSSPASSLNKPAGRGSHSSLDSPAEQPLVLSLAPLSAEDRPRPPGSLSLTQDYGSLTRLISPELVSRVNSPTATTSRAAPRPIPRWCQQGEKDEAARESTGGGGKISSTPTFQVSSTADGTVRSEMSVFIGGSRATEASVAVQRERAGDEVTKDSPDVNVEPASPGSSPGDEVGPLVGALRAGRRRDRKKRSTHYQESDLLESPAAYCRSSVADKISDYEDIWGASPARETPPAGSPFSASAAVSRASRETACALMEMAREAAAPSPLYAVPADALRERIQPDLVAGVSRRAPADRSAHRHSEPALHGWEPGVSAARGPTLPTIGAGEEVHHAASVDQLSPPPRAVRPGGRSQSSRVVGEAIRQRRARAEQWRLDSSWEFLREDDCDADSEWDDEPVIQERPGSRQTNSTEPVPDPTAVSSPEEQTRIVHAIIRQSLPMAVPPAGSVSASDYDNFRPSARGTAGQTHHTRPTYPADTGADTDADTDVTKWQSIMRLMNDQLRLKSGHFDADERFFTDSESFVAVPPGVEHREQVEREVESPSRSPQKRKPLPRSRQESLYCEYGAEIGEGEGEAEEGKEGFGSRDAVFSEFILAMVSEIAKIISKFLAWDDCSDKRGCNAQFTRVYRAHFLTVMPNSPDANNEYIIWNFF